jgi:hypothetical protein
MLIRPRLLLLLAGLACGAPAAWLALRCPAARVEVPASAGAAFGADAMTPGTEPRCVRSDKPGGPVDVLLAAGEQTGLGRPVHALLRPVRTLTAVTWRWELSPGVALAEGAASGSADPHAGAGTAVDAVLLPPRAGRPGRATLVTTSTFPGADDAVPTGPESVVERTELRWGEEADSPVPVVWSADAATGEPASFAVLPSLHRSGR